MSSLLYNWQKSNRKLPKNMQVSWGMLLTFAWDFCIKHFTTSICAPSFFTRFSSISVHTYHVSSLFFVCQPCFVKARARSFVFAHLKGLFGVVDNKLISWWGLPQTQNSQYFLTDAQQYTELNLYQLLYPPEASGGYFGLAFAMPPPPRIERFSALTL